MQTLEIVFLIISLVTLASAMMVVTAKRLMHSALWLILTLFGVAMVFATLQASFFAVVQVLVYIGAIAILILFAVMLTRNVMVAAGSRLNRFWIWGLAAAGGVFAGLITVLLTVNSFSTRLEELPAGTENLPAFGQALVDPAGYAIPFEVASVLLLAALVGAVYVAVERKAVEE